MQTSIELTRPILENLISTLVCDLTSIPAELVRPAYQRRNAPMPPLADNWCAFYIAQSVPEGMWRGQSLVKYTDDYTVPDRRNETVQFYFYGDDSYEKCSMFYSGLQVRNNWISLLVHNVSIIKWGDMVNMPRKINEQYVYRTDMKVYLSVAYNRKLNMEYFASAPDVDFIIKQ